MIIELARSFADFNKSEWEPYHASIEHLLQAHGQGWHMLAPGKKISDSISENCDLSRTQKEILNNYIRDKFPTLVGQARAAYRTILAVEDGHDMRSERNNQIVVPLKLFRDPRAVMPARLLTENAEADGEYLKLICRVTAKEMEYLSPMNLEIVHGGGSTTAVVLSAAWSEARPMICVVDSDRRYPRAPLGGTAKAIDDIGSENEIGTVCTAILDVREIENLLPLSFLFEVYKDNPEVNGRIAKLHSYLSLDARKKAKFNVIDYIDFKDGIRRNDIAALPAQVKGEFVVLCKHISDMVVSDSQFDDTTDCTQVFPGIAEKVLPCTIEFLRRNPHFASEFARKIRKAPFWDSLEPLIEKIISFSTASERLPVHV